MAILCWFAKHTHSYDNQYYVLILRFEAEIEAPGGPPKPGSFILGAKTFDNVQEQLSYIRQETTRLQVIVCYIHVTLFGMTSIMHLFFFSC